MRRYGGEDDYWRIREYLRQVMRLNDRRQHSWPVARLDYWRWHVVANCEENMAVDDVTFIWEIDGGRGDSAIAAVLTPEGAGEVHLHVHPGLRSPELENEMVDVAEAHLAVTGAGGKRRLRVYAHHSDAMRREMLAARGYAVGEWPEYQRYRPFSLPIPDVPVAEGYTVRGLREDELPARSWASWKAFHPDDPDEEYEGWEWYRCMENMPLYRRNLDVVAVAPNGEIAAFCTYWYDDITRSIYVEPVGTVPAHQRRGLGKAVMLEALRRAARLGAVMASVGSYSEGAHALYHSVGFAEYELLEPWVKELD
jgi:ribosomal protein S18 acetylase RimI-like enzyme